MKMFIWPGPKPAWLTDGANLIRSSKFSTFSFCSVSPVIAWIEIGTSCSVSLRHATPSP